MPAGRRAAAMTEQRLDPRSCTRGSCAHRAIPASSSCRRRPARRSSPGVPLRVRGGAAGQMGLDVGLHRARAPRTGVRSAAGPMKARSASIRAPTAHHRRRAPAGTMPMRAPTRPAWTAAITPASSSDSSSGTQSAVSTTSARSRLRGHQRIGRVDRCSAADRRRWPRCDRGSVPSTRARRDRGRSSRRAGARLAATAAGSSPTWSPRLKES